MQSLCLQIDGKRLSNKLGVPISYQIDEVKYG